MKRQKNKANMSWGRIPVRSSSSWKRPNKSRTTGGVRVKNWGGIIGVAAPPPEKSRKKKYKRTSPQGKGCLYGRRREGEQTTKKTLRGQTVEVHQTRIQRPLTQRASGPVNEGARKEGRDLFPIERENPKWYGTPPQTFERGERQRIKMQEERKKKNAPRILLVLGINRRQWPTRIAPP